MYGYRGSGMHYIYTLIIFMGWCLSALAMPHSEETQKKLHIGYTEFKPYIWSEEGKYRGIYIDILQEALTKRMQIPTIFEEYPSKRIINQVSAGKLDAFIDISTAERREYSQTGRVPVAVGMVGAFTYKGNPKLQELAKITNLSDLKKYKILTYNGDSWAKENLTGFNIDHGAKDLNTALKKLKMQRGDIILQIEQVIQYNIQQLSFNNAIIQLPHIVTEPFFYQLHISNKSPFTEIIEQLDKTLIAMLNDGTIENIYKKYDIGVLNQNKVNTHKNEIKLIHYSTGIMPKAFEQITQSFNKEHKKLHLKSINLDMENYKQTIKVMLAGGRPADMLMSWAGYRTQYLVDTGAIEPIDDLWESINLDQQFSTSTAQSMTYNNHKYAIPLSKHIIPIFYNKRIFQENNLNIPTTWHEFINVGEKLKSKGIIPISLGSKERWPAQFWFDYLLVRTAGHEYRNHLMVGDAHYNDDEIKLVYALWKDLIDRRFFNKNANYVGSDEASKMLYDGQAAMTLNGTWTKSYFENTLGWKASKDYGIFSFPIITPAVPLVTVEVVDTMIQSKAGNVEATKEAMKYFTKVDNLMKLNKQSGTFSPNKNTPSSFYSPMLNKLSNIMTASPYQIFSYDLSTPPLIAEIGLTSFKKFIDNPNLYQQILEETHNQAKKAFKIEEDSKKIYSEQ